MTVDYSDISPKEIYKLMSQSIIPRPVAWIVTQKDGVINAAPFSYFTALSSRPPTVVVSIGHKADGSPKDTLRNLRETGRCTLCLAQDSQMAALHATSKSLPAEQSETETFGIATRAVEKEYPPMIEGVPVAFFCTLLQEIDLKESKTIPVILRIEKQYLDDNIVKDKERLRLAYEPLARVGAAYAKLGEMMEPPAI